MWSAGQTFVPGSRAWPIGVAGSAAVRALGRPDTDAGCLLAETNSAHTYSRRLKRHSEDQTCPRAAALVSRAPRPPAGR